MEEKAHRQIIAYSNELALHNYTVSDHKKGQYKFSADIQKGGEKLILIVYYGKKGLKTVLQGDASDLFINKTKHIIGLQENLPAISSSVEISEYIGTDESGKGDYFGPLVIAGVFVNQNITEKLYKLGVRDSKELSDKNILFLSSKILEVVNNNFNVIVITPATYNKLHASMKNVNKILGWAHAKVIENILQKINVHEAISDKFGDENLILNALQERGKKIKLSQFTKAERFTGVAAASILARSKFINWFSVIQNKYGVKLPKGASSEVIKAGRMFISEHGNASLNDVAKIHFKTTKQLFS